MLYYPQLSTASYPIPSQQANHYADGIEPTVVRDNIRMNDPGAATVRWRLQYSNLTDDEWTSIDNCSKARGKTCNVHISRSYRQSADVD